jgi:hypothetical protein
MSFHQINKDINLPMGKPMKTYNRLFLLILALAIFNFVAAAQFSTDSSAGSKFKISPYGRLQLLGFGQSLNDNVQTDQRIYIYLKEARFGLHGSDDDIKFDFQFSFGGEDLILAPSPGISLQLLDFSVDIPLTESLRFKAGQFKVPYGREGMANTGYLTFGDRSIQYNAFVVGWDVGFALYGSCGNYNAALGVFTGGGRDIPIKYLPEKIGIPLLVLRAGYNDGYDDDILTVKQSVYEPKPGAAIYLNALYTADSKIGHSTVLNVKGSDKSLLLDGGWNPYIGISPMSLGQFWQIGADGGIRTELDRDLIGFAEAEVNLGGFDNGYGALSASGGRVQFGINKKPYEIALRYAFISPSSKFAYTSSAHKLYPITGNKMIHEITLGATYFLKGDRLKLIVDMPILIQVPVINDPVSGAYVLTQQQGQVSYIATGGKIDRQNVIQGRLELQYAFE